MLNTQLLNSAVEILREYGAVIRDAIGISEVVLITILTAIASIAASTLLQNKIKDIAITIDEKLYNISKNHGRIVRALIPPIRFVLPSNPLQGYIDYRTATSLENNKIIDLSTVSKSKDLDNPAQYWRLGFTLQSIMSGLTVDRENTDGDSVTHELITELENDDGIIVVGQPGSGKSTICKQVACEWYEREIGPVLYRESGHGPVTEEAALKETIQGTPPDQTLLIVIEDVCNPEHIELIEPLMEYRGENVRYLFDSRVTDLENLLESRTFDTIRSKQTASALISEFRQYPTPNIDVEEIQRIINEYEQITGEKVIESAESIYQRIENSAEVGQMLMLAYEISSDSTEIGSDGLTGLEIDVSNKYSSISNSVSQGNKLGLDQYNPELLYNVCFSINLYNVVNIPLTENCLLMIGNEDQRNEIRRILQSLEGWLLFKQRPDEENEGFETYHELWSVYYLRQSLSDRSINAQDLSVNSMNSFLDLLDIDEEVEAVTVEGSADYKLRNLIYPVLLHIYRRGHTWPAISDLFTEINIDNLHIPKKFRPELDADLAAERSITLLHTGYYDRAEDELNKYYEIATEIEEVDQDKLENFYDYTLARIYIEYGQHIKAEQILSELLDDFENGELSKAYLLNLYGIVTAQSGRFQDSIDALDEAIEIARENEDSGLEQNCLLNMGITSERGNRYKQAEEYYEKAVEFAEQTGNLLQLARANHNLGQIIFIRSVKENDSSRIPEAKDKLEYSYRIKQDIGDNIGQAKTIGTLANIYHEIGELDTAEEYLQETIYKAKKFNQKELLAGSYHNYAVILRDHSKIDEAEIYLLASLDLHKETGNVIESYRSLDLLVSLQLIRCDIEAAADYAISALDMCIEVGDPITAIKIIRFILSLCEITDDPNQEMKLRIVAIENLFYISNMAPSGTL